MRRFLAPTFLAILFMGVIAGCGTETKTQNPVDPLGRLPQIYGFDGWLPTPQSVLDDLQWEEFHGTTQPGLGGALFGTMSTWPSNSNFAVIVPPTALPDDDSNPVDFSLRIPTYESYQRYQHLNNGRGLPLILDLEPSGTRFLEPVIVYATYMPWVGANANQVFELWTTQPAYEQFSAPTVWQDGNRVRLTFEASHFSIWETGPEIPD